jgi:SOS-response transcriptional repressor LexA
MTTKILEIGEILSHLLQSHGMSEAELGRKIKVPRATINRLVSGRTPDPRASTLKAIAEYFNVSVDQILGKQPLFSHVDHNIIATTGKSVPIIDWKSAENWEETTHSLKPDNYFDWIICESSNEKNLFALRVRGDSMWPQFQENTILIIDPNKQANNKGFVIVYIKKNDEIVFRQLILEGNYKFLKALNPIFPTIQIGESDRIIGVIIQMVNSFI